MIPCSKNDLYDHIISEMKTQKKIFSLPRSFIEDYMPAAHREPYRVFPEDQHVATKQFNVDISEIKSHLKRRSLQTATGVRINSAPRSERGGVMCKETHVVYRGPSVVSVGP
jgi:hypothetical protein